MKETTNICVFANWLFELNLDFGELKTNEKTIRGAKIKNCSFYRDQKLIEFSQKNDYDCIICWDQNQNLTFIGIETKICQLYRDKNIFKPQILK